MEIYKNIDTVYSSDNYYITEIYYKPHRDIYRIYTEFRTHGKSKIHAFEHWIAVRNINFTQTQ